MVMTLERGGRARRHHSWFARVSVIGAVTTMALAGGSWARAAQQASPPVAPEASAAKRSVWDGVYTEDQAQRGKELYAEHCVRCHGENLESNGPVKALSGPDFAANWNG